MLVVGREKKRKQRKEEKELKKNAYVEEKRSVRTERCVPMVC